MATLEQLQAQLAHMTEQQNQLVESLRRAHPQNESQAQRTASLENQLQATQHELTQTRTYAQQLGTQQAQQAQQPSSGTQGTGSGGTGLDRLIHPSNVPKPHLYDGRKEGWEKFKHVFVAWSSTVHHRFPELLERYGKSKDPVDETSFTTEEDLLSKAMYTFLMQYCPEPTMNVIGQGLPDANGFEVWRRLVTLSEPSYRTKAWVWRRHLSNPNFPSDIDKWSTALHHWESEMREYERSFKTPFSEDEKVSILAHIAPKELQQSIFMHSDALDTYAKIREYIEQYLINKNVWKRPQGSQFGLTKVANKVDDGPVPMDIGAVKGDKGAGKDGKGKGDKGKWKSGKGKGKKDEHHDWSKDKYWKRDDKGKGKDHRGKGKGEDKGKGKKGEGKNDGKGKGAHVNNPDAGKQCYICNKYGHIAKECWWKVSGVEAEGKGNASSSGDIPKSSTGGSNAVGSIRESSYDPLANHVFTVRETDVAAIAGEKDFQYLLVDSGACENVAKYGDFQEPIDASKGKPLFGVQGNPLKVYGKQFPEIEAGQLQGTVDMTVTDAAESLLSVYNILSKGHEVHFVEGDCHVITRDKEKLPLELHGKRWYLKVKRGSKDMASSGEHQNSHHRRVAPVAKGVRIEQESEADIWKSERTEDGEYLIRVHNTGRFQLFNPARIQTLPVPLHRVMPGRLTKMVFSEDGETKEDESLWTRSKTASKNMGKEWLGETWFKLYAEEQASSSAAQPEAVKGLDLEVPEEIVDSNHPMDEVLDDWFAEMEGEAKSREEERFEEFRRLRDEAADKQVKQVEVPRQPTLVEREEHRLHHANFEPWCETCIMGQGKDGHHQRQREDKKEHIVYSDYMFFSRTGEQVSQEEGKKQRGLITVLTAICKDSQFPFAVVVPSKGGGYYARDALAQWIRELGWDKVTIHVDQENAMNKLYERVQDLLPGRIDIRKSPRYSSQSLADGEMVNGLIAGKVRTWMCEISESYSIKLGSDSFVFPWIVRHSAWTLGRFHINHSKTTAYKVLKGHDYVGELLPLGETVMGKFPRVKDKAAPRWIKGIYVGKTSNSEEHLLMTESGTLKFRTVRRLPVGSQFQDTVMEKARGVPWNTVMGSTRSKPEAVTSELSVPQVPQVTSEELYEFEDKEDEEKGKAGNVEGLAAPAPPSARPPPIPQVQMPLEAPTTQRSRPATPRTRESQSKTAKALADLRPAKLQRVEQKDPMKVDDEGEKIEIEESGTKKARTEEGPTSSGTAGNTVSGQPELFRIDTPEGNMSRTSTQSQDMIAAVTSGDLLNNDNLESKVLIPAEDAIRFKKWLNNRRENFQSETVANIMDYLDAAAADTEERKKARKSELKKLNEDFHAFTVRNGKEIPREITVFGHKWVDKVTEGVAKARLTCQDFKRKGMEDKNSSEAPSNFCPTPHGVSRKVLEVYSLATGMPRVKADLTSAFLIASDQGDKRGQPVMMRPPQEWLEDYDDWYLCQNKEVQEELKNVAKEDLLWQVDGNLYGRQSAAAQYRDRLDDIITKELPVEQYEFERGKIDACVYKCKKTGTVLVHHIDDFDICGPESVLVDLLTVQFPKNGCKLKMGEMEHPNVGSKTTSEFLGRTKVNVEGAVITKPNEKHVKTILQQLGLEEAKAGVVPGKKLELNKDTLLNETDKVTYASCVGSAIYLSQDRPDIKFSVKELAKRIREPRECDMMNLKVLGRYLRGTAGYGHVTKIDDGVDIRNGIPLHCYCDSDWAGDVETRRSTSGEAIFLGGTLVESSSHTQPGTPATSSGEAEIRALTHCAQTAMFVKNVCEHDFGLSVETPRLWSDSSAALQASRKMGVGKMRHIAVAHMYIQELVKSKQVIVGKIDGKENPSDILTKHLSTGDEVRQGSCKLGLVDLTKDGLDRHVSKMSMKSIGAVSGKPWKPWKPQQATNLTLRQYHSAICRNKRIADHTGSMQMPGNTGNKQL